MYTLRTENNVDFDWNTLSLFLRKLFLQYYEIVLQILDNVYVIKYTA